MPQKPLDSEYVIIPPLGTHRSATRKTVIRNEERINPHKDSTSWWNQELLLNSEPEANPATAAGGLPLIGSERNATMKSLTVNSTELFLSSSPSTPTTKHFFQVLSWVAANYRVAPLSLRVLLLSSLRADTFLLANRCFPERDTIKL